MKANNYKSNIPILNVNNKKKQEALISLKKPNYNFLNLNKKMLLDFGKYFGDDSEETKDRSKHSENQKSNYNDHERITNLVKVKFKKKIDNPNIESKPKTTKLNKLIKDLEILRLKKIKLKFSINESKDEEILENETIKNYLLQKNSNMKSISQSKLLSSQSINILDHTDDILKDNYLNVDKKVDSSFFDRNDNNIKYSIFNQNLDKTISNNIFNEDNNKKHSPEKQYSLNIIQSISRNNTSNDNNNHNHNNSTLNNKSLKTLFSNKNKKVLNLNLNQVSLNELRQDPVNPLAFRNFIDYPNTTKNSNFKPFMSNKNTKDLLNNKQEIKTLNISKLTFFSVERNSKEIVDSYNSAIQTYNKFILKANLNKKDNLFNSLSSIKYLKSQNSFFKQKLKAINKNKTWLEELNK